MSGVEVLGVISGVIGILDSSIKIYDSVLKDKKLPETFKIVRSRMPFILDTLQICANKLRPNEASMPPNILDALDEIVFACEEKAGKLQKIFEKVIPTEEGSREQYLKVVQRWGKGKQVEELMEAVTKDVQLLVNHDAVRSATPEQNDQLEHIVKEMQSLRSSIAEEQHQPLRFESGGGAQTNNVNSGSGQQVNNNGQVGAQNFYGERGS